MLIPGLPPAGAQQEVFKPDRQVRTKAAEGLAHDPLADLPVEDESGFEHTGQHSGGSEQLGEPQPEKIEEQPAAAPGAPELPRKGLLVDIRA